MNRVATAVLLSSGIVAMFGCGGSNEAPPASSAGATSESSSAIAQLADAGAPAAPQGEPEVTTTRAVCTGRDIDLDTALIQKVCEIETDKDAKYQEVAKVLEVKVNLGSKKITPGSHVDVVVTYTNKGQLPLALDFMIDPVPRFTVEAYDAKGKRVDVPKGDPPPPPKDATERLPSPQSTARVIISPFGIARVKLGWDAVRTKWAPEKYKGTPVEVGYPRKPAGPLPAGKYQLRIATPLVHVMEGTDHELSGPKVDIEVGK
ncbi:hypothetical protein LVJ94_11250 [Pendulispora rubella]|uniref:Uncharacterized protein n=1 Tax=Pendulispora rubella TaxID=2741070 RepID=A0ABZ2LA54_9BACT